MFRADMLIKNEELRKVEKNKVKDALRKCGYPEWALREGEQQGKEKLRKEQDMDTMEQVDSKPRGYAVIPYTQGVSERLRRVYKKHGISLYSKAGFTVRNAVVSPKDPLDKDEQCGVIYQCACDVCGDLYIGETGRSLGERMKEHNKAIDKCIETSALSEHQMNSGHIVNAKSKLEEKIVILDKENKEHQRKICEAIHIKIKGPKLNRNDGHDLPDIYLPLLREEEEGGRPTFASHR